MPRRSITISDADIAYAEAALLPRGKHFDEERRRFIKNLETIDLQAVPGSGKTTALLAKLLILERYLPFEDGSGILVLSHTNAAIDEIGQRIGTHCPKLFGYPNFVGTIQTFVDQFLTIPYYAGRYGKRPRAVNDILYIECAQRFNQTPLRSFTRQEHKNAQYYLHVKGIAATYRLAMREQKAVVVNQINGKELDFAKPKGNTKPTNYTDFSSSEKSRVAEWLIEFKRHILATEGILHFDDAYFLADCYMARHPKIKMLLRQRFQFVFVDEMQDMESHQHRVLEEIFHDDGGSLSVYQRIGDRNQAIYSSEVNLEEIWSQRPNVLSLTGSVRLSPTVARVVEPLGLSRVAIDGRSSVGNALPPYAVVFDDDSAGRVIQTFCTLVKELKDAGRIPEDHKYPIKAIAWRKVDDGKFGLKDYWSDYEAEVVRSKTHYPCLKSYLCFARQEGWQADGLTPIHKKIMDALTRVLHIERVLNPDGGTGYVSERGLLRYLRETKAHADFYDEFRMKLLHWSKDIYRGASHDVYRDVKEYIPELLRRFDKQLDKARDFVDDDPPNRSSGVVNESVLTKPQDNVYRCPTTGIDVHVGTVHSAKGETHTATLYLESMYQGDYESQRLKACLEGRQGKFSRDPRKDVYKKQSCRMAYVGFSRPTHLLCFAVHKDRLDEAAFRKNGWSVVYAFDPANTDDKQCTISNRES